MHLVTNFGMCTTLMVVMSVASVFSVSLEGIAFMSKVNPDLVQPALLWSQQEKRSRDGVVQLCGFRLVEAVRTLCRGNFASSAYSRRSDPTLPRLNSDFGQLHDPSSIADIVPERGNALIGEVDDSLHYFDVDNSYFTDLEAILPQNAKSKIRDENKSHPRFRRSISEECCKKACSIAQMTKYCASN